MHIRYTKLDTYDYRIEHLQYGDVDIVIQIDGPTDITIADIATELTASEGYIYVEGNYYRYDTMLVEQTELHILALPIV